MAESIAYFPEFFCILLDLFLIFCIFLGHTDKPVTLIFLLRHRSFNSIPKKIDEKTKPLKLRGVVCL